jgi:hypothetical protein
MVTEEWAYYTMSHLMEIPTDDKRNKYVNLKLVSIEVSKHSSKFDLLVVGMKVTQHAY